MYIVHQSGLFQCHVVKLSFLCKILTTNSYVYIVHQLGLFQCHAVKWLLQVEYNFSSNDCCYFDLIYSTYAFSHSGTQATDHLSPSNSVLCCGFHLPPAALEVCCPQFFVHIAFFVVRVFSVAFWHYSVCLAMLSFLLSMFPRQSSLLVRQVSF